MESPNQPPVNMNKDGLTDYLNDNNAKVAEVDRILKRIDSDDYPTVVLTDQLISTLPDTKGLEHDIYKVKF